MVWNITCHERGPPFFLEKYIVGLPRVWQCWHLWCLFCPSVSPFCASASPSVLPLWAVLLRLKYWSLLRLTLSWQSVCDMVFPGNPVNFQWNAEDRSPFISSVSMQLAFIILWFLKNFYNYHSFSCYINYYLVYEWNRQLMKLIKPAVHTEFSLTPIFTQDLWSSAVVTIGFSVTSFNEAVSPRLLIL